MVGQLVKFCYFRILMPMRRWFWRRMVLSGGGSFGPGAAIYESVRIAPGSPGSIHIGHELRILRNAVINTLPPAGEIHIGSRVHIGEGTMISSHCRIDIGDDVVMGPYNVIVDVDHVCRDRSLPISVQGLSSKPIRIGQGAWISSHCVILKGVTIGRGAVIGAGAIVTGDIPDYAIAVGAPARVVKSWGQADNGCSPAGDNSNAVTDSSASGADRAEKV